RGGQTVTGEVAVMASSLCPELFQQAGQGAAPMADAPLLLACELAGAAFVLCCEKYRVIAKPCVSAGSVQNPARPAAVTDDWSRVVRMAQVNQHAVELCVTFRFRYILHGLQ